jgi:hypothetical protein
MILVYIHELPTGLLLPRCHYPALDVAHAQMRFFAYFDYFFADLLGRLPLLQQMVALHYKQRIKYKILSESIQKMLGLII